MSLMTPAQVRDRLQTTLTDPQLQVVIDREEADVVRLYGPHHTGEAITESLPGGGPNLYLRRRPASVTGVTEWDLPGQAGTDLTENAGFFVWAGEGRLERLPQGAKWGARVEVVYVPQDDTDRRQAVILELVRLALERTAMRSEEVLRQHSYQAPDWEAERARLLRRLRLGF